MDIYNANKNDSKKQNERRVVNIYIDGTAKPGQGLEEGRLCFWVGFDMTGKEVTFTGMYRPNPSSKER